MSAESEGRAESGTPEVVAEAPEPAGTSVEAPAEATAGADAAAAARPDAAPAGDGDDEPDADGAVSAEALTMPARVQALLRATVGTIKVRALGLWARRRRGGGVDTAAGDETEVVEGEVEAPQAAEGSPSGEGPQQPAAPAATRQPAWWTTAAGQKGIAVGMGALVVILLGVTTGLFDRGPAGADVELAYRNGVTAGEAEGAARAENAAAMLEDARSESYDEGFAAATAEAVALQAGEYRRGYFDGQNCAVFDGQSGRCVAQSEIVERIDASYNDGWNAALSAVAAAIAEAEGPVNTRDLFTPLRLD